MRELIVNCARIVRRLCANMSETRCHSGKNCAQIVLQTAREPCAKRAQIVRETSAAQQLALLHGNSWGRCMGARMHQVAGRCTRLMCVKVARMLPNVAEKSIIFAPTFLIN